MIGNAMATDIDRIYVLNGKPMLFGAPLSNDEIQTIGAHRVTLGARFRKALRCPVNGDGYWVYRRWVMDESGKRVGFVSDGYGGEL